METQVILDRLYAPTHLFSLNEEIYVSDQPGSIWKVGAETSLWLDLTGQVLPLNDEYDESGLLSFVLTEEDLYLFSSRTLEQVPAGIKIFSAPGLGETSQDFHLDVVSRIPLDPNGYPQVDQEVIYFALLRDQRIHHGGKLLLDQGGYLYITTGDGGPQADPYHRAQNLNCAFGKVLRIKPQGEGYTLPSDNPFLSSLVPEIYAYGFRNPWSLNQDRSGRLFLADVGYETKEEINLLVKGGNYGWNIKEGTSYTPWTRIRPQLNLIDPIFEYSHRKDGSSAVMGGFYLEGGLYPEGYYLADLEGPLMLLKEDQDGHWSLNRVWEEEEKRIYGWGYDGTYLYLLISDQRYPEGEQGQVERILSLV